MMPCISSRAGQFTRHLYLCSSRYLLANLPHFSRPGVNTAHCNSYSSSGRVYRPIEQSNRDPGSTARSPKEAIFTEIESESESESGSRAEDENINSGNDQDMRTQILERALANVASSGWSEEAIATAVLDLGLPPLTHKIIERGAVEIVEHFLKQKNEHVTKFMTEYKEKAFSANILLSEEDLLLRAIEEHFTYIKPYQDSWPAALALLSSPSLTQIPFTLDSVLDVVGDLCYLCYDDYHNSVGTTKDSNASPSRGGWYSRRMFVMCTYGVSELYMLTDKSPDLMDTKAFMRNNMEYFQALGLSQSQAGQYDTCGKTGVGRMASTLQSLFSKIATDMYSFSSRK